MMRAEGPDELLYVLESGGGVELWVEGCPAPLASLSGGGGAPSIPRVVAAPSGRWIGLGFIDATTAMVVATSTVGSCVDATVGVSGAYSIVLDEDQLEYTGYSPA